MFELTFLGTSSGVPTKQRNVSAIAVSLLGEQGSTGKKSPWILVDCGEATQHQLLHTKLKLSTLKAILITHTHGDHCYGLAGLLASLSMHGRTEPLIIIAPQTIKTILAVIGAVAAICAVLMLLKKKFGCKCCCQDDGDCCCNKPDTVEDFVEEATETLEEKAEEVKEAAEEKAEAIAEEFKDYADVELPKE